MINKEKFEKTWEFEGRYFGLLKTPVKISKNNVRQEHSVEEIKKSTLLQSIKDIGLQQVPVANGQGEIFIGGRRCLALEISGKVLIPVEIRDLPDPEQMCASYSENKTKLEMTADEEGKALKDMTIRMNISRNALGDRLGESHTYIKDRIRVYEVIKPLLASGTPIPYGTEGTPKKAVTFRKARSLCPDWIPVAKKKELITKIQTEGISRENLESILTTTRNVRLRIDNIKNDKVKQQIETELKPLQFTEKLDKDEADWLIRERTKDLHPLKEKEYPIDEFESQEKADEYARQFGGRCLGKVTKEFWKLELDTVGEKLALKQKEVEEK